MPTITNQSSTTYQFDGSSDVLTANSNINTIELEENQNLVITKTSNPDNFVAGSIITYTVVISNTSSSFLTGVRIIDNLGSGNLAYVIGSASLSTSTQTYPVNPVATSPLTFTLQELNVGESMTLTYRAQVIFNLPTSVNSITNTVQGIGYTSSGTINGFDSNTIFRNSSSNQIVSTKTSSSPEVFPNQSFNYNITLSNDTPTSVTTIETTDQLPSNYILTGVQLKIGNGPTITLNNTEYTLSNTNLLTIPSLTGPVVTVPAGSQTIITLTGYFE